MKVLFVASSRSEHFSLPPHVEAQRASLEACGVDVDSFRVTSTRDIRLLKTALNLRKLIRQGQYDVVHAHYVYNGLLTLLANGGRRTIVSFLGSDVNGTSKPGGGITLGGRVSQWASIFVVWWAQWSIVKSQEMKQRLPRRLYRKVEVVPNGVDFEKYRALDKKEARRKLGLDLGAIYVLFMGNPNDYNKNINLARDAVAAMSTKTELLSPYPVESSEVVLYMNAANVVILTSLREGSPNIVKEAMACSRPIVSVHAGDAAEVVGDTPGCFVVGYDKNAFAVALDKAITFGATHGRATIDLLRREVVAERIISIYKNIEGERS